MNVNGFAGAHRPVQGAKGQMPSLPGEFARLFCQPAKSSAVALEHQGAGKRTMPAPPRKLKLNPKKGGIVFLNHLCISRGDQGVFEGSMVPAPFPTSRAIGRATCKRISRKGGRGESSEQAWGGREMAFAPAHLAQSNKPSRDLNLLAGFPDHPITRSPDYPILLSDTPQGLRGGAENNPIKSVRMSHAPAVPPRPLKATADDVVSGVIQAGKSQYHKLFSFIRCTRLNPRASNHVAAVLFCCGAPPPPHSVSPWDKFQLALMSALLVAAAARFIYLRCSQRRDP